MDPAAGAYSPSGGARPAFTSRFAGLRFVVGLLLVALSAAAFAVAFHWTLGFVVQRLAGVSDVVAAMRQAPWWQRLFYPALGGLAAGLLGRIAARSAIGHGVSNVMEAVVLGRIQLSMRVTWLKSAGSWLAIASGGSIGREGPLIQFGGAVGKFFGDQLRLGARPTRLLIAAGTAAGFAAAYNTPFAAVLFVLEVVTGVIVLDAVVPVLIATVVAASVTRAFLGAGPIYGQRAFDVASSWQLVTFVGLGLLAALVAQAFMRVLSLGERAFRQPWLGLPLRPAAGGLLAGSVIVVLPEVAGNGYQPLNALLDGRFSVGFVALLLLAKALATTASVASGSPGGVFTPTLLIGGATGFIYAWLLSTAGLGGVLPGSYALVGMAAAIAATTHAPLLAAVMVFELSGDYSIALPLILATAVATLVSRALRRDSIYAAELRERGIGWEVTLEGRRVLKP